MDLLDANSRVSFGSASPLPCTPISLKTEQVSVQSHRDSSDTCFSSLPGEGYKTNASFVAATEQAETTATQLQPLCFLRRIIDGCPSHVLSALLRMRTTRDEAACPMPASPTQTDASQESVSSPISLKRQLDETSGDLPLAKRMCISPISSTSTEDHPMFSSPISMTDTSTPDMRIHASVEDAVLAFLRDASSTILAAQLGLTETRASHDEVHDRIMDVFACAAGSHDTMSPRGLLDEALGTIRHQSAHSEDGLPDPSSFVRHVREAASTCSPGMIAETCPEVASESEDEMDSSDDQSSRTQPADHMVASRRLEDKLTLHLLDELKFALDVLHAKLDDVTPDSPQPQGSMHTMGVLYRLLLIVLFVVICRREATLSLLDRPEHRKHRNWVMSAFFRSVLRPVVSGHCADTILLSKIGLARLDSKQKKIPREVVESVLRPALMQFCDLQKLNMRLIAGLHSIVELFPTLFKEVFGKKILETLGAFLNKDDVHKMFPGTSDDDVCKMLIHMLDFFRLFGTTCSFSCEQWIPDLCSIVLKLEATWSPQPNSPGSSCHGFQAPLCRLLCLYPSKAVSCILRKSSTHDSGLTTMFKSMLRCKHATPIIHEYRQRTMALVAQVPTCGGPGTGFSSYACQDSLSDVTLVLGPDEQHVKAHRIVLASRSAYFQKLFTIGMMETNQKEIRLPDVDSNAFRVVLRYLYGEVDDLSTLPIRLLSSVFELTDRYGLDELQNLCEHHMCGRVTTRDLPHLIDLAIRHNESADAEAGLLTLTSCGDSGGESLLRTCQSHLLANLGLLADTIDTEDPFMLDLLASDHRFVHARSPPTEPKSPPPLLPWGVTLPQSVHTSQSPEWRMSK